MSGIINCCSGFPITVSQLVEKRANDLGSKITLNKGYYSIPDYEPLEFWGVSKYDFPS
jgi:dTDP-6-deoxy-L-talose 4-dehydrogenase (NAD+)